MTTLAVMLGAAADQGRAATEAMIRRAPWRGDDVIVGHAEPGFAAATGAFRWQHRQGAQLALDERWVVVADASLYPPEPGAGPAEAILRRLGAAGESGLEALRGDYAVVVWDRLNARLVAIRDYAGGRPLFLATCRSGQALSSTAAALVPLAGVDATLNLVAIAEDAGNLDLAVATETAYRGIQRLPAGHRLVVEGGVASPVERWWDVPVFERGPAAPFEEASLDLRERLIAASVDRLDGDAAVWLSGGYDSTAVFAAACEGLRRQGQGRRPRSVSFDYPEGDEGREHDFIAAACSFWDVSPHWVDIRDVPSLENPLELARTRDEPFHHPYHLWNRSLARATRNLGCRSALSGNGGDQWFSVTPIFFADLVARGQWGRIPSEWRDRFGAWHWRSFVRVGIQPNLPGWAISLVGRLRGAALRHYTYRRPPVWFSDEFVRRTDLLTRRDLRPERRPGEGHAAWEHGYYLRAPYGERVSALVADLSLREGVEIRSPLFDDRVIRLAATRPREEANSRGENKHLLRSAARPLLPPLVTAERRRRTGQPATYLLRTLRDTLLWAKALFLHDSRLADLGILDKPVFLAALSEVERSGFADHERAVEVLSAIHAECWLQTR